MMFVLKERLAKLDQREFDLIQIWFGRFGLAGLVR